MRRANLAPALLLGAALTALSAAAPARAQAAPPSAAAGAGNDHVLRAAVVRVVDVQRKMQEAAQTAQMLQGRLTQMQQQEQTRRQEIQTLIGQANQLKAGSPQWLSLRDTVDNKKLELEVWAKKAQLELDRTRKAELVNQFRHVNEAVQAIAEREHLDLVVIDSSPEIIGPDLDGIQYNELTQVLASRAVAYASKKADITEEVLTLVDANFAKQKQSVGAGPTGGVPPAPGVPATNNK